MSEERPIRAGVIKVSYGLLHQLLHLPDDVEIRRIQHPQDTPLSMSTWCELLVVSEQYPGLPEIQEGECIPYVDCVVTKIDGQPTTAKIY